MTHIGLDNLLVGSFGTVTITDFALSRYCFEQYRQAEEMASFSKLLETVVDGSIYDEDHRDDDSLLSLTPSSTVHN